MLCFILDTPHRGRYFHDCNTPDIRFASRYIRFTIFYRSSAADASPPGSTTPALSAEKSSQKSGPGLTERREPKVIDFHQIRRSFPHGDHPQSDPGTTPRARPTPPTSRPPLPTPPAPRASPSIATSPAPASPPTTRSSGSSATPSSRTSRARSSSSRRTSRSPPTGP